MRRTMISAAAALIALTGAVGTATAQPAPSYDQTRPYDRTRPPIQVPGQVLQRGGDAQMRRAELARREDQFRREEEMKRDRHAHAAPVSRHHWRRGERLTRTAWNQHKPVYWRDHQLKRPARGYEWRQVDNNYVLARSATRRIVTIVLASH